MMNKFTRSDDPREMITKGYPMTTPLQIHPTLAILPMMTTACLNHHNQKRLGGGGDEGIDPNSV
jgi:hypothetical protein